jgi:hypothetical protein
VYLNKYIAVWVGDCHWVFSVLFASYGEMMKYLFVSLTFLISFAASSAEDCIEATDHLRARLYLDGFQSIKPEKTENGLIIRAVSDHEIILPNAYTSKAGYYTRSYSYVVDPDSGDACNFSTLAITFKRQLAKVLSNQECLELKAKYQMEEKKKYRLWHPFRFKKPAPKDDATLYGRACELAFIPATTDDYFQE